MISNMSYCIRSTLQAFVDGLWQPCLTLAEEGGGGSLTDHFLHCSKAILCSWPKLVFNSTAEDGGDDMNPGLTSELNSWVNSGASASGFGRTYSKCWSCWYSILSRTVCASVLHSFRNRSSMTLLGKAVSYGESWLPEAFLSMLSTFPRRSVTSRWMAETSPTIRVLSTLIS